VAMDVEHLPSPDLSARARRIPAGLTVCAPALQQFPADTRSR
jgi:hypothetical protein